MYCYKIIFIYLLFNWITVATGILCYECDNESSHERCLARGRITRCGSPSDSCETEVRFNSDWPNGRLIFKRCKQTLACINNFLQNAAQCRPQRNNTVCFCCCRNKRGCNLNNEGCWKDYEGISIAPLKRKDKCKQFRNLRTMKLISCTDETNKKSVCEFRSRNPAFLSIFHYQCVKTSGGLLRWVRKFKNQTTNEKTEEKGGRAPGEIKDPEVAPPGEIKNPNVVPPGEINSNKTIEIESQCTKAETIGEHQRLKCTNGSYVQSVCSYRCIDGYTLVSFGSGGNNVTCLHGPSGTAIWSSLPPVCRPPSPTTQPVKKCQPLGYKEEEFLDAGCTNSSIVGSECNFRCVVGFMLTPFESSTVQCVEDDTTGLPVWTSAVPSCKPLSCVGLEVDNGTINCTKEFFFDSICSISCNPGFTIKPSSYGTTTCLSSLFWSHPPPICEASFCPVYQVPHGNVRCTDGSSLNSVCIVSCNTPGHEIRPPGYSSATCQSNQTWSHDPPCCAEPCPPIPPVDMVIIMDSSSSVGYEYWNQMKLFVMELIRHVSVGPNATNFAVFQYNRRVDEMTEILLNQYKNHQQLASAVQSMPYRGKGTWTGIALGHAATFSLLPANGNRPQFHDIVLVITDGQVNKKDDPLGPAKALLEMGAKVFVVGINPERLQGKKKHYTWQQLVSISGNYEDRVYNGFETVEEIYHAVAEVACDNMCRH